MTIRHREEEEKEEKYVRRCQHIVHYILSADGVIADNDQKFLKRNRKEKSHRLFISSSDSLDVGRITLSPFNDSN